MTRLLEKAFAKASRLPKTEQNRLARWFLGEIVAERRWDKAFAESQDILGRLAEEALQEHKRGRTKRLDPNSL